MASVFNSTISLPYKKFLFQKFLMTSLHVICSLSPLIKNSGYAFSPVATSVHEQVKDVFFYLYFLNPE